MKRTVAIVLLFVHLFTAGGYMLLFQYLINRSDAFVEQQISKGLYNVHDLVEVKVPVHLPQIQPWQGFERVSGQVQLSSGACYNYVNLKMTRDTMFIMCIPNYKTTRLTNANVIYAREVSDVPLNKKANTNTIKSVDFSKYNHYTVTYAIKSVVTELKLHRVITSPVIPAGFTTSLYQPPRLLVG